MIIAALLLTVFLASALLTAALRRYALARHLLDIPNARSSHVAATPRGGGLAIVVSALAGLLALSVQVALPRPVVWAVLGAGALVAAVGFLDDHGHIAARWRLLAHFVAAGWALGWLGGAPALLFPGQLVAAGWVVTAVAAVYLVWLLNLYNFMDGIDGIATVEAICVCAGGALLYALEARPELALLPLTVAAAALGFLPWNLPPARIFMGDAGSGFLGVVLGVLSLHAGWVAPRLFWAWVILLGVFVVDATVTLLRRLARGERVYEAHRSHAYQRASRRFGRHFPVTAAVAAIDLFWLLPIAVLTGTGRLDGWLGATVAYLPLLGLAIAFRAGAHEEPSPGAG